MNEVRFKKDNPGGDWLAKHRGEAESKYKGNSSHAHENGFTGKTTGYFSHTLKLPVESLKHVKGAQGEHHYRNNHESDKHKELSKSVAKHGFNSKEHPILVGVNHRGEPHVLEGNHRLAHAEKHGHSHIHAEVRYWNGGEDVKGKGFHPDQVLHYHNHGYGREHDKAWKDKHMKEDVAVNAAGGGAIAGIGIGPDGEPGVYRKKKRKVVMSDMIRRWMQGR